MKKKPPKIKVKQAVPPTNPDLPFRISLVGTHPSEGIERTATFYFPSDEVLERFKKGKWPSN